MKAYQVKAIVKNSKPPVWRRAFLPVGITFSQLSMILNEIFSLEQGRPFEFEFYQRRLRLLEEQNSSVFRASFYYDLQEASRTYIDQYLEEEPWFSYRQYSQDGQELYGNYRVEIEAFCEVEAVGPIIKKWVDYGPDGCVTKEDVLRLNHLLEKKYAVSYEAQPAQLKQQELLTRFAQGEYGFTGTMQPAPQKALLKKSCNTLLKEFSDQLWKLADMSEEEKERYRQASQGEDVPTDEGLEKVLTSILLGVSKQDAAKKSSRQRGGEYLLKDILPLVYPQAGLRKLGKELRLKGYNSLSLMELSEKIANELLLPSMMKRRLGILTDEEIQLFEEIMASEEKFHPTQEQLNLLGPLLSMDYAYTYANLDCAAIPPDVKSAYSRIDTPEFHDRRRKTSWLRKCLWMVDMIYGVAPLSVLISMLHQKEGCRLNAEQIEELFTLIQEEYQHCVLRGQRVISSDIADTDVWRNLEKAREDTNFYIPSCQEIEEYYQYKYPASNPCYQKLYRFFDCFVDLDGWSTEDFLEDIYQRFSWENEVADVIHFLCDEENYSFSNEKRAEECLNLLAEAYRHTRQKRLCGYTPLEYVSVMPKALEQPLQITKEQSCAKVLATPKAAPPEPKKIYPNDPCPCGSGKKYKKCCGKPH